MEKAFKSDAPGPGGTFHLLTNPIIQVRGDHATVREDGVWKFSSRVATQATTVASK
jgi:hypothetical protein